MNARAALFVDGFNLYHAVNDLGENFLKWTNLWELGNIIIPSNSEELVEVHFCTAYYPGDHGKRVRHEKYNNALQLLGVQVHMGHYIKEDKTCPSCSHAWARHSEKQTDINVALSLFEGAQRDAYDHGYLLSADSDQLATVKWFNRTFPDKKITMVIPPGRPHSKAIRDNGGHQQIQLNRMHFERAHMGNAVIKGGKTIIRPIEYAPPAGWVPPRNRP